MLEYPKLVWEILDAEKNLQKGKQYLFYLKFQYERWLGSFGEETTKHKNPWAQEYQSLCFPGFYKIGLTNFGNNKNVSPS